MPNIAIAPTTQEPAKPTGSITTKDCPNLLVKITSTAKETARLIPVELTIEEIKLESTFDKTIKSPSI